MSLFFPPILATILPRRSIGGFQATVTIEEVLTDELELTQHPVQQGASITDHAYMKPAQVSLKIVFDESKAPLAETYRKLLKLQADREPIDLVTGKRSFKNMLITSLGQTNDMENERVLSISMKLQEVVLTSVELVTVPERAKQKDPGKTGATQNAGQKSAQKDPKAAPKAKSISRAISGR